LNSYDFFVIGTSVYVGQLQIKKWLKKNLGFLRNKIIIFFQVAGSSPDEKEKRASYNKACIPQELNTGNEYFFLPGRLAIKKLSGWDRFILKTGARFTKDPAAKKTMLSDYDLVKREHVRPVAERINQLLGSTQTEA